MSIPTVSVIIPTYNRAELLCRAVDAILTQTVAPLEILIIDDGSTDHTAAALAGYGPAIRHICIAHSGLPATARNEGIRLAQGEWVAFCDSDDLWLPNKLEKQLGVLAGYPEAGLVCCNAHAIGPDGDMLGRLVAPRWLESGPLTLGELIERNFVVASSVLLRRSLLERAGLFPEQPALRALEDYDLWLRVAAIAPVIYLSQPLVLYRDSPTTSVRALAPQWTRLDGYLLIVARLRDFLGAQGLLDRTIALALRKREVVCLLNGALVHRHEKAYGRSLCMMARALLRSPLALARIVLALSIARLTAQRQTGDAEHSDGDNSTTRDHHPVWRHAAERLLAFCGRVAALLDRRSNPSGLFLFFPFYSTGGAERVHASIATCFADLRPWIIITNQSKNDTFLRAFRRSGPVLVLETWLASHPRLNHRAGRWLLASFNAGRFAAIVNRNARAVVFGANSTLYYRMLPYLKPHVYRVDLLHAFGGGLEDASLPVVAQIDKRTVFSEQVRNLLANQYRAHGMHPDLVKRIVLINNQTHVPPEAPVKPAHTRLQAVFVGRGSPEKRVHLIARVAMQCRRSGLPVDVTLIGDVADWVDATERGYVRLAGEVTDTEKLEEHYRAADVLLLVSSREGFPLVIMEAMAHGAVPIATAVGGIAEHVRDGETGFLIPDTGEDEIVQRTVDALRCLHEDRALLDRLSANVYAYARAQFSSATFCTGYRKLLLTRQS